jgi:endonuclease V-like protein UPF0215 family
MTLLGKTFAGALAASVMFFAGCKTQPVYEVVAAPIPAVAGKVPSMPEIEKAIMRGGARAGWQMLPEGPGRMSGRYQSGNHSATVGVDYDTKAFNIKMRDTSVRNDGSSVHRAYNQWVQNLDRSIRVELGSLGQ